jgi:hypothetical protein
LMVIVLFSSLFDLFSRTQKSLPGAATNSRRIP